MRVEKIFFRALFSLSPTLSSQTILLTVKFQKRNKFIHYNSNMDHGRTRKAERKHLVTLIEPIPSLTKESPGERIRFSISNQYITEINESQLFSVQIIGSQLDIWFKRAPNAQSFSCQLMRSTCSLDRYSVVKVSECFYPYGIREIASVSLVNTSAYDWRSLPYFAGRYSASVKMRKYLLSVNSFLSLSSIQTVSFTKPPKKA